jgi:transcriptional regulator with XRE-family HTH domain
MIKEARVQKSISRYKLSLDTGIAMSTLWRYENEKCSPGLKNLRKIATYLNVPIDDLL